MQNNYYSYNIRLLKVRNFLLFLKKQQNETQENLDKVYWMFTRFTFSALESGTSIETVRNEKIYADYRKHNFGQAGLKRKVLSGILQSNNAVLIRLTARLMGLVKRYLPILFVKVKK